MLIVFLLQMPFYNIDKKIENIENEYQDLLNNDEDDRAYFIKSEITSIVDGDTIKAKVYDEIYTIRLIGVNTPETVHPSKPVEFFGKEASEFTKSSLEGKTVYLQNDVSEIDRYGRLLKYVRLELPHDPLNPTYEEIEDKMFNAILLKKGYANASTFAPDIKYSKIFSKIEREAYENNVGLWDNDKKKNFTSPKKGKSQKEVEEKSKSTRWTQKTKRIYHNKKRYLADITLGPIKGNKNSKIYHSPGQRDYNKISINNVVRFDSANKAQKAGYKAASK